MSKPFVYETRRCKPPAADALDFLFEDGTEVTVALYWGSGYWYRVVSELRKAGKVVDPADFGHNIELMYYDYAREELREDVEKQARLGFFTCPRCECIYPKGNFDSHDPCDNCKMSWGQREAS